MVSFVSVAPSVFRLDDLELTAWTLFSDVTIRDQVVALHNEIRTTMPPIAGVVQGSSTCSSYSIYTPFSSCHRTILRR